MMVDYPKGFVGPIRPGDTRGGVVESGPNKGTVLRGGGGSSSSGSRTSNAARLEAQRQAEIEAANERQRQREAEEKAKELERKEAQLEAQRGRVKTAVVSRDVKTQEKIELERLKKGSRAIVTIKRTDPKTGKVTTTIKEEGVRGGGGSRQVLSGVSYTEQETQARQQEIEKVAQTEKKETVATGTFTKAPTFKEQLKQSISEGGYVAGTFNFLSNKIVSSYDKFVQKNVITGERTGNVPTQGELNLVKTTTRTAPYFVPIVGEVSLAGEGVEKVAMSKTKTGKALGVAEIGLGSVAGAGRFKQLKATREATLLKKGESQAVVGARLEGDKVGVDVLKGYSKTKPTKFDERILNIQPTETITNIRQPFIKTKKGAVFEGGQATAISKQGKNIEAVSLETSGFTRRIGSKGKLGRGNVLKGLEAEASAGTLKLREKARLQGFREGDRIIGTKEAVKGETISKDFISVSKSKDDITALYGSNIQKGRLNLLTGERSVSGQVRQTGAIKTKRIGDFGNVGGAGTQLKTTTKTTTPTGQTELVQEVAKTVTPKVKPIQTPKSVQTSKASSKQLESVYGGTGQYERTSGGMSPLKLKQQNVTATTPSTKSLVKQRSVQLLSPFSVTRQKGSQKLVSRTRQDNFIKQVTRQQTVQKPRQIQRSAQLSKQQLRQITKPSTSIGIGSGLGLGGVGLPRPMPPFSFDLGKAEMPKVPKSKKKKGYDDLGFARDLTAIATGLKPVKVKKEDLGKIKVPQLGIRRGVVIK